MNLKTVLKNTAYGARRFFLIRVLPDGLTDEAKEMQDGCIVDAWINYTHQQTWMQYPVLTAKQNRMTNTWSDADAFKTIQDALQFYPSEEDVGVIGASGEN